MVAEAVREAVAAEETQVPQPEVEAPPSPPAPETPEQQADAPDTSEPTLESALDEFLRGGDVKEEATAGTDPDAPKPLSPEAQAEVDRHLSEQAAAHEKLQRETGVVNALRDWATNTRTQAAQAGVAQNVTDWFIEKGIEAMNLKTQVTQLEASESAAVQAVDQFYASAAKTLPAKDRQAFLAARGTEHKGPDDTLKALRTEWLKDYVHKSEITKIKTQTKDELRAFLIEKKLLKGHDAPPAEGGGGGASHNAASDNAILDNPTASQQDKFAAYARKHGTRHPLDNGGN